MKKLIGDPKNLVLDSVRAMCSSHPEIVALNEDPLFVHRPGGAVSGKVGLISGGGSGHEPLHAGFVGAGMLDAAVPGAIFTSPTPEPIEAATRAADGGAGVLHIVKNYTGDVLNFETAAELADDVEVASVVVDDDVAVEDSSFTAGRRGVAGTILVEKVAGAAADRGEALAAVKTVAQRAIDNTGSMGLALTPPIVPHTGQASFDLEDNEVEIGIGIHGEPGRRRIPITDVESLTDQMVDPILADLNFESGQEVVLLVNSMGATTYPELCLVYAQARKRLEAAGVVVARSMIGAFVTALDMAGASVTVMRLDAELKELLDAPATTLAWGPTTVGVNA